MSFKASTQSLCNEERKGRRRYKKEEKQWQRPVSVYMTIVSLVKLFYNQKLTNDARG